MNEISPEQSEAIIEAAARGEVVADAAPVAELLAGLHTPAEALGAAPVVGLPGSGFAGRVARRTAVAASAAVLGLASVAAATTGAGALLGDDPAPTLDDAIVEEAEGEAPEAFGSDDETPAEIEVAPAADEDAEEEAPAERAGESLPGNRPEIEGVDASDGLDEAELELLCDGAENHGHYVSSVARDKATDSDESHGERVREAAASDCGKDDADEADDTEVDDTEVDDDDAEESDDDDAEESDDEADEDRDDDHPGNGNGNGNAHGNGHEKAKGNGHGNNGNGNGHDRD